MTPLQLMTYMVRNNYSPITTAKALGVSFQAVESWLEGKRKIPNTTIKVLNYFEKNKLDLRGL